jgi:iron(III) transport system ATP-binding protein
LIKVTETSKIFGGVKALDSVSMDIEEGEFFSIVGPSGCGKSTLLRCLAGLEVPDSGEIVIGDELVTSKTKGVFVSADKRHVGMVFQNYALWPHMSVFQNVSFPLELLLARMTRNEIVARVNEQLNLMSLEGMGERYPHQLSGGQQQRVALARALVAKPKVLLLDEPLSNLDAKLRETMKFEIKSVQEKTGVTVVYVTHDQDEAMAISDRILVLNQGMVHQVGTPQELYENPKDAFTAGFIGMTNLIQLARVVGTDGSVSFALENGQRLTGISVPESCSSAVLAVRAKDIEILEKETAGALEGTITRVAYQGHELDYLVDVGGQAIRIRTQNTSLKEKDNVYLRLKKTTLFPK